MRPTLLLVSAGLAALAAPARAEHRLEVHPYLEIDQVVFADLKNGGDTVTYTAAAAGVEATINTRRTQLQADYRYEHRFAWDKRDGDSDVHTGLLRGRTWLVPELLQLDAGALATRTRTDIRGAAPNPLIGDPDNVSQLYSVYVGPTLATRIGDLNATAAYRFGYTKLESRDRGLLPAGQPLLDSFDDETSHLATASIGMGTNAGLPFGWTASAGYERDDAGQLDQRFESENLRYDVVVPLTPTVAGEAGIGYEKIEASQRDALRDTNGNPVLDGEGRFVTDPASPRLLAYDQDGIIWDVGVLWRPSRRTSVEARFGRRYGGWTYTGAAFYQPNSRNAFQLVVYDGVTTFGRQLNDSLAALPTQFTIARSPFGDQVGGCVYATSGGGCLDDALQSVATGVYRTRGATALWSYRAGPWTGGVGLGYARRRFHAPVTASFSTNGVVDQSWYGQAYVERALDARSGIDASVYASLYDSGIAGAPDVLGTGATLSYYRTFWQRLEATAALGLYSTRVDGVDSTLTGSALLGARYQF